MQEQDIIDGLLRRDERITQSFLFGDDGISFKGVLVNVLKRVYGRQAIKYEEAAGEFYRHLMEDEGRRLRSYDVSRGRLYGWLRTCAVNLFVDLARKNGGGVIEKRGVGRITGEGPEKESAAARTDGMGEGIIEIGRKREMRDADAVYDDAAVRDARDLVTRALFLMKDRRRASVVLKLCLQDMEPADLAKEMGVTVQNLYNIKRRSLMDFHAAVLRLTECGLKG